MFCGFFHLFSIFQASMVYGFMKKMNVEELGTNWTGRFMFLTLCYIIRYTLYVALFLLKLFNHHIVSSAIWTTRNLSWPVSSCHQWPALNPNDSLIWHVQTKKKEKRLLRLLLCHMKINWEEFANGLKCLISELNISLTSTQVSDIRATCVSWCFVLCYVGTSHFQRENYSYDKVVFYQKSGSR